MNNENGMQQKMNCVPRCALAFHSVAFSLMCEVEKALHLREV